MEQNNSLYRLNFITQDSAEPMQVVKNIASNMQTYPIKNILIANNFAQEINHKDIKEANKEFDDNNLQIIYLNKNIATNLQSQWYKTDYFVKGISIKDLQKWRKLANDLVGGFNIQTKNPFIFSLSKE
jgi:secreted Zn-dependent insulinase-like peptidase